MNPPRARVIVNPAAGASRTGKKWPELQRLLESTGLEFDHQIFVDKRPDYYCFANKTREQTGAEVFAEFASQSE